MPKRIEKKLTIFIFIIALLYSAIASASIYKVNPFTVQVHTYPYRIINNLNQVGYLAICNNPVDGKHIATCSIPIKITAKDTIRVFPLYRYNYVVFTTENEKTYSCASIKNPFLPLPLTVQNVRSHRINLFSFITDRQGKKIAIRCW